MNKNLHQYLIIEPDFIDSQTCDYIVDYARNQEYEDLSVFDSDKTNETGELSWRTEKNVRDTQTVDLKPIYPLIESILNRSVLDVVNPALSSHGAKIKDAEGVQLLRYGVGGHYNEHVDGESIFNNYGQLEWRRSVDRDVSIVMYLNDKSEFEGGDLHFPNLGVTVEPQKGMFVAFPSYKEFLHGVRPVTSGERFALVTWMRLVK